jgi:hypothetical protein
MTNGSPGPDSGHPFRPQSQSQARDPAAVTDAMVRAEHAAWERTLDSVEGYRFDLVAVLPPGVYLLGLLWRLDGSPMAYILWAIADVFWTPWLILRVDARRPPGDTARATAFLGYAQLGWPLSALAIPFMPVRWEFLTAFPIVFLWSLAFTLAGVWRRRNTPRPGASRAAMLAGGAFAWLACALLLLGAAALIWTRGRAAVGDTAPLVFGAILIGAVLVALPGVCLAPIAWKTWRRATP